ncbi:trehalose-phosphatase [Candidatus Woesearchaeota archaeon]|nr:trehalose-phosphatase [Candidatus Woesearchaeota archaeon]
MFIVPEYLKDIKENPAESGILTDLDGTLTEIAPTPGHVTLDAETQELLCQLAQKFKICGIVTGRSIADARRIVGLDELMYVGNHGLEQWDAGEYSLAVDPLPYRAIFDRIKPALMETFGAENIEDKGLVLAVHYRQHPEREPMIEETTRNFAQQYHLSRFHGNKLWELRPNTDHSKGSAIKEIAQKYALTQVMYSGDDYADYTAFQAVKALHGVVVMVNHQESPPDLKKEADIAVNSVGEMKDIFHYLVG